VRYDSRQNRGQPPVSLVTLRGGHGPARETGDGETGDSHRFRARAAILPENAATEIGGCPRFCPGWLVRSAVVLAAATFLSSAGLAQPAADPVATEGPATVAEATSEPTAAPPTADALAEPAAPSAPAATAAGETKTEEPAPRTRLKLIPDKVLKEARKDSFVLEGGPRVTSVTGNAFRFRHYTFVEPTSPLIMDRVHAWGTNDEHDVMYDAFIKTPFQRNRAAGLELRDFDGPSTARAVFDRFGFYQDYAPNANPSYRQRGDVLLRTRFGSRGWMDVRYARRARTSPFGTFRAIAFAYDEVGLDTTWRFGAAEVTAFGELSRYVDATAFVDYAGQQLTANRTGTRFGLRASSVNYSDFQWSATLTAAMANYGALGNSTTIAGGLGLWWRLGHELALKTGLSHARVPQTITRNTYNPKATTLRLSGDYTGIPKWRVYFGAERRIGTRFSTEPQPGADEQFTESQTVDRLWVKARMKSHSDLIIETAAKYRRVRGNVTNYLNNDPTIVPLLIYPSKTSLDLMVSYPTGVGLLRVGGLYANYSNGGRAIGINTYGITGHWTKVWSEHWTTLAQYDRIWYDTQRSAAPGLDTRLSSFVLSADWGFRRGSVSGSLGLSDSDGGFTARQRTVGLALNYDASEDTALTLSYQNLAESLTGNRAYDAHVLMLRATHDF